MEEKVVDMTEKEMKVLIKSQQGEIDAVKKTWRYGVSIVTLSGTKDKFLKEGYCKDDHKR